MRAGRGQGVAEVARQYQISPKRLENWKGEWRAKGELAFPGKGARPQSRLDSERIAILERKIGQQTMEIDFLKKVLRRFKENPLGVDANGGACSDHRPHARHCVSVHWCVQAGQTPPVSNVFHE